MKSDIITSKQDLTYLSWSVYRSSSSTAGSFLKSYSELGGIKTYYKLSNYDNIHGITGHECVNEIIVDRLLTVLGVPHLHYQLLHADIRVNGSLHDTYICASENFRERGESKVALDTFYDLESSSYESPLDFCIRMGWENYIYQMLAVDFLILNRDRHGANIEVLRNSKDQTFRLAPLFDHGLSLLCRCTDDSEVSVFKVTEDKPCNNFIGSKSTRDNLQLIPEGINPIPNSLTESDRTNIMADLNGVISNTLQNKIWEMLWERWCVYEAFCNSGRI